MRYILLFTYAILFLTSNAFSASIVQIDEGTFKDKKRINISSSVEYYFGNEVFDPSATFQPVSRGTVNFDYHLDYIWLKLTINNNSNKELTKHVHFTSGLFRVDNLYSLNDTKLTKIDKQEDHGFSFFNSFIINLKANEKKTYIIMHHTIHRTDSEVYLYDKGEFLSKEFRHVSLNTFYLGIIFSLFLYNFILFFLLREKSYLLYSSFLISMGATVLTLTGFVSNIIDVNVERYLGAYSTSACLFTYLFAHELLDLEKVNKKLFRGIRNWYTFTCLGLIVFDLTPLFDNYYDIYGNLVDINILSCVVVVLITATYMNIKKPTSESKVYLFSWLFLYAGVFAYFASSYGLISFNYFTQHSILFGNIVETFTLSIALGLKINRIKKENEINQLKDNDKKKYIRLLRVLSHDIANSLFVISAYSGRFLRRGHVDDSAWPKINRACNQIKGILDSVKNEQALINNNPSIESINLNELFSDLENIFLPQCREKGVNLVFEKISDDISIFSNKSIITHQVLGNFISNAIKFTPTGGEINISAQDSKNTVRLTISDTGIGIDESRKFKIINRIDTGTNIGTNGEKGTGFGYYIISSYCEQLNMKFSFNSQQKGTGITLVIPKEIK